jgi:hypothetical protein
VPPVGGTYRRHEPEKTVLYGVVREHLETFLDQARDPEGGGYPRFIERAFRRYLECGLLAHGFARLRCAECGYERLVSFSCKSKLCPRVAFRPSCLARRTADTAAWLVDHLSVCVSTYSITDCTYTSTSISRLTLGVNSYVIQGRSITVASGTDCPTGGSCTDFTIHATKTGPPPDPCPPVAMEDLKPTLMRHALTVMRRH